MPGGRHLTTLSLVALALGLGLGILLHDSASSTVESMTGVVRTVGRAWLTALQYAVVPLVVTQAQICSLEGRDGVLEAISWREGTSLEEIRRPISHLFLFIGAEPNTQWLSGSGVALDPKGFVVVDGGTGGSRHALETSLSGVFAIGDVRSGSIKRVAAAVGEGAQVVAALHEFLAQPERRATAVS